jgi:hypothetical protein
MQGIRPFVSVAESNTQWQRASRALPVGSSLGNKHHDVPCRPFGFKSLEHTHARDASLWIAGIERVFMRLRAAFESNTIIVWRSIMFYRPTLR